MKRKNKKPLIFMVMLLVLGVACVGTFAYYTSRDTYENIFEAGTYSVTTQEKFESPDNWTPGTTTPKTIKITNNGSVPVAVRVQIMETWEDEDGTLLPLYDSSNNPATIINYSDNYDAHWNFTYSSSYSDSTYRITQYYYNIALSHGESTTNLIDSVTFNPSFKITSDTECVTDNNTHETTCTTVYSGYSGGKYKMTVGIETIQYDQYENVWGKNEFYISPPGTDFNKMSVRSIAQNNVFGKTMSRTDIESVEFVTTKTVPNDAIDSWDASQLNNESVMAWIKDTDNDGFYELYVGADGGVKAPTFCNNYFAGYNRLHLIDLTHFDTSKTESMYFMFAGNGGWLVSPDALDIVGLEELNVSNVRNMEYMFSDTGSAGKTYDFSNWDISKVTNMSHMFSSADFTHTGTDNWPLN